MCLSKIKYGYPHFTAEFGFRKATDVNLPQIVLGVLEGLARLKEHSPLRHRVCRRGLFKAPVCGLGVPKGQIAFTQEYLFPELSPFAYWFFLTPPAPSAEPTVVEDTVKSETNL